MKYADINKKFTEKVAEYIAKGYTINTKTMDSCGGIGVFAGVDLTNGKEIIRVYIKDKHYFDMESDDFISYDMVCIVVGKDTRNVPINEPNHRGYIDNDRMEIISEEIYYQIAGKDFFGTREDSEKQQKKSHERIRARHVYKGTKTFPYPANARVLSFMQRQKGCKTIKLADIEKVVKDESNGTYWVYAKNKRYQIA